MNYTVKATGVDVVFGSNTITSEGQPLTTLDIASLSEGANLISKFGMGELELLEGETIITTYEPVISTFLDIHLTGASKRDKVIQDYERREVAKEAMKRGMKYVDEAIRYYDRAKDGQRFLFAEVSHLVTDTADPGNPFTQAQMERVDVLTSEAMALPSDGQFKTTYKRLDAVTSDPSFNDEEEEVKSRINATKGRLVEKINHWY